MRGRYAYRLADGYLLNLFNIRNYNENIEPENEEEENEEEENEEENIEELSKEEEESERKRYNEIIESISEKVDGFYCIKSANIPRNEAKEIKIYLIDNGWKYTTALTHSMRCRGFKRPVNDATDV
jgi:predicted  nucleic acid-binding Zn-ribbon protein